MNMFEINQPVFGVSLETVMSYQKEKYPDVSVPIIFLLMRDTVIALKGETTEGIFRIPGKQEEIDGYKELFNQGKYEIYKECSCHTIAGLFKSFVRELPSPVIPLNCYDKFVDEQTVDDIENDVSKIQPLLDCLPPINKAMTIFIINFLQRISSYEEKTKMGIDNLAMVFSACMLINDNIDPFSALTKTNVAKSCIAALIRHLPEDAMKQINISIEGYTPLSGITQVDIDPIIQYIENKQLEEQTKSQTKEKEHAKAFGLFRSRAQSQSKKRGSNESPTFARSVSKEGLNVPSFQSLSGLNNPGSSLNSPHKRVTSVCFTGQTVSKSIEKETEVEKKSQIWDLNLAPRALVKPSFLVSKTITV
ncbi:hypothetical protein ENUP19_0284G0070 [Entamoeba nuttalli]|uniref:RhoGAP domain containing protein n=2 Tax=Entamoeba nuttalli TaxID=412467 RepID=K2HTR1_ENTNP|nr:RhoGAP domain containing protein [Entamoeba nuttalli P19]EKE39525.1 RhoGAP domain containing protein [Entamoeba nuttalli P19]|eukprot:XP_008858142.1 RhoGAP domain containing protein [Entamoeba nuttalli P19]